MNYGIAENFILKDQNGNNFELYKNLDKKILLIFYPKDNSYVCSKQLHNYEQNLQKFEENGIKVIGINADTIESHKSFCEQKALSFPLLADTEKTVSRQFKALNLFSLNKRKLVLINTNKEIVYDRNIFQANYLDTEEILEELKTAKLV